MPYKKIEQGNNWGHYSVVSSTLFGVNIKYHGVKVFVPIEKLKIDLGG